jgi:hypothetical protein
MIFFHFLSRNFLFGLCMRLANIATLVIPANLTQVQDRKMEPGIWQKHSEKPGMFR